MKFLLVGNGAREHSIAEALARSGATLYSFVSARNPGIVSLSAGVKVGNTLDPAAVAAYAKEVGAEIAVIGPEAPLEQGVADALEAASVRCIGPKKELAKIETSKSFTRQLFVDYKIPGSLKFRAFSDTSGLAEYLDELGDYVVKADGLEGGKGVKLLGEHLKDKQEAMRYAQEAIAKHGRVVIEEKLIGEEFSLQGLVDGKHVVATPLAQDHKRAFEGDVGPNTGGMGSYSCEDHLLPFVGRKEAGEALAMMKKTVKAVNSLVGEPYVGVLYGGFMLTKDGVKLVEYNSRFADPECMNVLPILESNFSDVCDKWVSGRLGKAAFSKQATVCKYAVPEGYPTSPVKGERIEVGETAAKLYYASVDQTPDGLVMLGSRAVACVGIADDLEKAEALSESAIRGIKGRVFHRSDIGTKALVEKRMEHMRRLRDGSDT